MSVTFNQDYYLQRRRRRLPEWSFFSACLPNVRRGWKCFKKTRADSLAYSSTFWTAKFKMRSGKGRVLGVETNFEGPEGQTLFLTRQLWFWHFYTLPSLLYDETEISKVWKWRKCRRNNFEFTLSKEKNYEIRQK